MTESSGYYPTMTADQRKAILAQAVAARVAASQCRVESHTDFQAVLVHGKPVNHVLHLILTLATCSLWALVWIIVAVTGGESRTVLAVDDYGNVVNR